jgi:hypothetical protein
VLPGCIRSASMHAGRGAVTQPWPLPACTWSITLSDTLNDERSCHCHFQSMSGLWRLLRQFSCFLLLDRGGQPWPARYRAGASQPLACLFARHQSACATLSGLAGRSGQSVSCSLYAQRPRPAAKYRRAMRNVTRPGRSMACQNCVFLRSAKVEVGSMPSNRMVLCLLFP